MTIKNMTCEIRIKRCVIDMILDINGKEFEVHRDITDQIVEKQE